MRQWSFVIVGLAALALLGEGVLIHALIRAQPNGGQIGRYQSLQRTDSSEVIVLDTSSGTLYLLGRPDSSTEAVSATLNVVTGEMVTRKLIRKVN